MTPDFLQGFYACLLLEGIALTVLYIVKVYYRSTRKRCKNCNSPNIDASGRSVFPLEALVMCPDCGETMGKQHAPSNAIPVVKV